MIRAILDNKKTMTRRVIKLEHNDPDEWQAENDTPADAEKKYGKDYVAVCVPCYVLRRDDYCTDPAKREVRCIHYPKHDVGDILYVRETWQELKDGYVYRATPPKFSRMPEKWRPSLFMPKAAARIFLRVTGVRAERLQDITEEDAKAEGAADLYPPSQRHCTSNRWVKGICTECKNFDMMTMKYSCYAMSHEKEPLKHYPSCGCWVFELKSDDAPEPARFKFMRLWEEVGPTGCGHNPWVWVYEFERVEI
jgi:hypothetical protein